MNNNNNNNNEHKSLGHPLATGSLSNNLKLLWRNEGMDNMSMALEYPQEEEYAMGNLSPLSFYHGYYLPGSMSSLFSLLSFKENDEKIKNEWKQVYMTVLKKATLIMRGKRLVLKNPLNTCRIPVLLEMFPEAKFIYLYRNPYMIYYSLLHTFSRMISSYQLEKISKSEIEEYVLSFYQELIHSYWNTKGLIPSGNLVEVRFEDLEDKPLEVVEKIYTELNFPAFESNKDNFEKHIISQNGCKKTCSMQTGKQSTESRSGGILPLKSCNTHFLKIFQIFESSLV